MLSRFAKSVSLRDYDVIGVYEIPDTTSENELRNLFPNFPHISMVSKTPDGQALGSIMAIMSRRTLVNTAVFPTQVPGSKFTPRAFISAELEIAAGNKVRVFAIHPRLPLSKASMHHRDSLLGQLKDTIGESQNFIIMGDFNLTPWTPAFRNLPGKRAGDPRLTYTWDTERPWLGIPIDHILIGNDFEVVEANVLPAIGSDHSPITATLTMTH